MIDMIFVMALIILFAFLSVSMRNIVYGVVFLLCANVPLGILYYMMGAPTVALFQIAIFAGAIVVFFIVTVMFTKAGVMDNTEEKEVAT